MTLADVIVKGKEQFVPKPTVKLIGEDGNAFSIMAKVARALRRTGHPELAERYLDEAKSGDYDNLLAVTMEYVDVE